MGTGGEFIWMAGGGIFLLVLMAIAFAVIVMVRWRAADQNSQGTLPPESPQVPPSTSAE